MRFVLAMFLVTVSLAAQNPSSGEPRQVLLDVISERDHVQVDGLTGANFRVRLDGQPVRVLSAERVALKARVAVLLDSSGSMRERHRWMLGVKLARAAVEALEPLADVSFAEFSDRTRSSKYFTDAQQIADALNEMEGRDKNEKGFVKTALRDSIISAIESLGLREGDAVLLVTDGGENASSQSEKRMEQEVLQSGVRVFAIVIPGVASPEEENGPRYMARFAEKTGGTSSNFTHGFLSPIDPEMMQNMPGFARYMARRIVLPYLLVIESGAEVNGKLQIEAVAPSGQRMKNVMISAPSRLEPAAARPKPTGP